MVKKEDQIKHEKWTAHRANTKERKFYATRRMDLLIISISGAGIYIIFETLREFKTGKVQIDDTGLLIWSGIPFLFAITLNFISQLSGYSANKYEDLYSTLEIKKIEGEDIDMEKQNEYDCKSKIYNKITSILNVTSMLFMFVGMFLLAIFNLYLLA